MILYKNTNKEFSGLMNSRFVYQEAPKPKIEATPTEMQEADRLAEKQQDWNFRMDVKPAERKKIEKNPWTDQDQKKYDQLLAKMTDTQRAEHDDKFNKRAESFIGSEKVKKGQVQEADYAKKTAKEMAEADIEAAKKQIAKATAALQKEPETISEEFSAKKKEQALKLAEEYNGNELAKLFGGSPKKLIGSTDKKGLIEMIESKGFTNDQARQIESVIYNATKAPFRLPNGKKVSQMEYYKYLDKAKKEEGQTAKLDLGPEFGSDEEANKKAAEGLF